MAVSPGKTKILVVEDELVIAIDLVNRLNDLGYDVYGPAGSGEKALELIEHHHPDLVLMDIVLHGSVDGTEVAEIVRDRWGIPVVFLTAHTETERLERAKLSYPFGFLLKPYQTRDLKITLEMALYVAATDAERKKAETELKLKSDALEHSLNGFNIIDGSDRFVYANRAYLEMWGYDSLDEILDTSPVSHFVDPSRYEFMVRTLKDVGECKIEFLACRKDGTKFEVLMYARLGHDDLGGEILICSSLDITQRKQVEAELENLSRQREVALNAAKLGWWHYDPLTEMADFDERYREIFGVTGSRRPNEEILELLHPDDLPHVWAAVEAALDPINTQPYAVEYRIRRADGDQRLVEAHGIAAFEGQGENRVATSFVGTVQDITERRKVEQSVLESEKRFRLAMEAVNDGVWDWNIQSGNIYYSPSYYSILGIDRQSVRPGIDFWVNLLHPEDKEDTLKANQACIDGYVQSFRIEFRMRHRNGDWRWILGRGRALERDAHGKATRMIGTHTDITNLKAVEGELRKKESLLRNIAENYPNSYMSIVNQDLAVVFSSGRELKKWGLQPGQFIGLTPDRIFGDQAPVVKENYLKTFAGQETVFELFFDDRNQLHRTVPLRNEDGDISQILVVVENVTERRKKEVERERTLTRQKQQAEILAGIASSEWVAEGLVEELAVHLTARSAGVLHVERAGIWLFVDDQTRLLNIDRFQASTGTHSSGAAWEGTQVTRIFDVFKEAKYVDAHDASTDPRMVDFVDDYLKPNRISSMLGVVIRVGGKRLGFLSFEHLDTPHHWADDEVAFTCQLADQVALCILNRERDRAEKEKENLQEQLLQSQKMEAIGTLAGGISHDFNNLLQIVNGYTQMLLLDKEQNHPDYESLKAIRTSGKRAAELVRQLLLFSRKVETERKPVELNHEVSHAQMLLQRTIPKMVDIEVHMNSRLWTIEADPVQMEQILLNLGTNAADAMPDGGKLILGTENVILDESYALNNLDAIPGKYVLLTVSDTGAGMDRDMMEHIFEPFYTTKEIGRGTGLGLASVYGIVKSHGGYIHCYSEAGRGTTFRIYLPVMEDKEERPVPIFTKPHIKGGTETVLLVEDEGFIRRFAAKVLKKYGYTVLSAASGEEALEIYFPRSAEIDLVIMDIGMPGMGGHRCLQEIIRFDPSARVLVASGYSINRQVKSSLEAGAIGYIAKPYQIKGLLEKVRLALDPDNQVE